jgi:perosamine synthetase
MISHMRGHTSDMDAIMALCDARGIPVIEDAAHSLGTTWNGRNIGTIGKIGCFSFQSYKLVNAGEGGIMVTDDPELAARAIIMSGAYEENWKKHPGLSNSCAHWQNRLPLYNLRMQNLSAAVIRPQLPEVARRVAQGRANHDWVADRLNGSGLLPCPLPCRRKAAHRIRSSSTCRRLVGRRGARLPEGREAARRLGSGLRPVGWQCTCLSGTGSSWRCPTCPGRGPC